MKKYILTRETHPEFPYLRRIQAIESFGTVKKGDMGGFVQSESNLSHEGLCWIADNAIVKCEAVVSMNAQVEQEAYVCGWATITGDSVVTGSTTITDYGYVSEQAVIRGRARVFEYGIVKGQSLVEDEVLIFGHAQVLGGHIKNQARVLDNAVIQNNAFICDRAKIAEEAVISDKCQVRDDGVVAGKSQLQGKSYITEDSVICATEETVLSNITTGINAYIKSKNDIFIISHIGPYSSDLTIYQDKYHTLSISYHKKYYTLSEFIKELKKEKWKPYFEEMDALLKYFIPARMNEERYEYPVVH